MLAALICCTLAILGCNAQIQNAVLMAALNQDPLGLDAGCINPAAYKKTVLLNEIANGINPGLNILGGGIINPLTAAAIGQQSIATQILGGNNVNQVVLANLLNNNLAQNSGNVLQKVLANKLGADYSEAVLGTNLIDMVAGNPLINSQSLLLQQGNPLQALNQIIDLQPEVNALGNIKPSCPQNVQCLAKTEILTQIVAENVCQNNLVGNKIVEAKIACNAGALIGKTVGQIYGKACEVAGVKYQQKTQQCISDACIAKEALIACCKNEKDAAKGIIQTAAILN